MSDKKKTSARTFKGWVGIIEGKPCFFTIADEYDGFLMDHEECPIYRTKKVALQRFGKIARITYTVDK